MKERHGLRELTLVLAVIALVFLAASLGRNLRALPRGPWGLSMTARFTRSFTAEAHHIDELGHVNNAVWVQWIQDLATAHWNAVARPQDHAAFFWVVVRHEIDYRANIALGESAQGSTFIPDAARGGTSVRVAEFTNEAGQPLVSARTTWAMLDREKQRLVRVRPEVLAPFRQPTNG